MGYLIYRIYKLLRGTAAFNIFIGVLLLYILSWIVNILEMRLLAQLLGSFVSLGLLIVIIIFQPEVRKFLLMLGNTTLKGRMSFLNNILKNPLINPTAENVPEGEFIGDIHDAIVQMSKEKVGALIVITEPNSLEYFANKGVTMDAKISKTLLRNIFFHNSPLHDGAVIITDDRIHSASAVLPLTDRNNIDQDLGMRHRAAIGVTETANAASFIVSEENGQISYANNGKLEKNISATKLRDRLKKHLDRNDYS